LRRFAVLSTRENASCASGYWLTVAATRELRRKPYCHDRAKQPPHEAALAIDGLPYVERRHRNEFEPR
jgi:hypothetical protein